LDEFRIAEQEEEAEFESMKPDKIYFKDPSEIYNKEKESQDVIM
jgi:hypothetical protein